MAACKCGRAWTSIVECHCTICHNHFRNVESFDFHLLSDRKRLRCLSAKEMLAGNRKTKRLPMLAEDDSRGPLYSRRQKSSVRGVDPAQLGVETHTAV